jgi:hypothetical protein
MPRGRHRHSSTLTRILPPVATGGLTAASGAAILLSDDLSVLRVIGTTAVAGALTFAALLRRRDRAGEQALDAAALGRQRAEERHEEQIAELEYAVEVAEERASRLGRRLTVEKSRLARAETENARLLRERAVAAAEQAVKDAEASSRREALSRPRYPVTPTAYVRAGAVLRTLERRAAVQHAQRVAAAAAAETRRRLVAEADAAEVARERAAEQQAAEERVTEERAVAERAASVRATALAVRAAAVEHAPSSPATAIVPVERQRPRPPVARTANFSFFDRNAVPAAPVSGVGDVADLTDVIGDEAVAEQARCTTPAGPRAISAPRTPAQLPPGGSARASAPAAAAPGQDDRSTSAEARMPQQARVVDLTVHDETERLDLRALRSVQ